METSTTGLLIRPMDCAELDLAIEWAAREGWNPGLADAECFFAADPDGFLLAVQGGEPAACISVVRYPGDFSFLGFYIVRPDLRGRGIGYQLWQAGLARLDQYTVGLDGVVAQQDNYRRSGFVLAHRNIRFGGSPSVEMPRDPRLQPIAREHIAAILDYDGVCFGVRREDFLRCWLQHAAHGALALIDGTRAILGYGVIRPCRTGFKIGPLFARDEEQADILFKGLALQARGGVVFLDVPEPNAAAVRLAGRYGLSPVFETARMYRGRAPDLPIDCIFGITTFELG